jgi:hypothetical protein
MLEMTIDFVSATVKDKYKKTKTNVMLLIILQEYWYLTLALSNSNCREVLLFQHVSYIFLVISILHIVQLTL